MLEPGPPSRPCFEWHDFFHEQIGVRCEEKERNGRCFPIIAQEGKSPNIDLSLRLSLPGLQHQQDEASRRVGIIDMNSMSRTDITKVPSLVLMGCARCLIYVMVSEVDPKCPKCKRTVLVDVFRHRPAKKPRRC
ncbi:hypothetical protein NC652_026840 [Populus alba x Populus x berolinensis]|nr:hypothetical protein NC652_026840 [Populus alba x Populus x berolinensis]KAJ6983651.1 hypothetical protein NC653_026464 [Populus alba x Populus x berolinensis]